MRGFPLTRANIVCPSINKDICVGTNIASGREQVPKENIPFEDLMREILDSSKDCRGLSHQGKEECSQEIQGNIAKYYTFMHVDDDCVASSPLSMSSSLPTCEY